MENLDLDDDEDFNPDVQLLKEAWINEKCCPELMNYETGNITVKYSIVVKRSLL